MHRIFGEKLEVKYIDRKGAYLIPIEENKIAVVKTKKGYFLLGGGIGLNETDVEAILRECKEEIGYQVSVDRYICSAETYGTHPEIGYFHPIQNYYLGTLLHYENTEVERDHHLVWIPYDDLKGGLYVKMQNWALDECWKVYEQSQKEDKTMWIYKHT